MKHTGQKLYNMFTRATGDSWPRWENQDFVTRRTYNTMAVILNEQEDPQSDEVTAILILVKQQQAQLIAIETAVLAMSQDKQG